MAAPLRDKNPVAISGGGPDTSFNKTRIMGNLPHVDGLIMGTADQLGYDNRANITVTRVSAGQWALVNTAGVQTYNQRFSFGDQIQRLGELFNFQEYNSGSTNPSTDASYPAGPGGPPSWGGSGPNPLAGPGGSPFPKGVLITDFFVIYSVATAALTTATLRLGYTQYANNVAPNQVNIVAATGVPTATQAQPYYADIAVPLANQVWMNLDLTAFEVEAQFVAAATTVLNTIAIGCHCLFNYN